MNRYSFEIKLIVPRNLPTAGILVRVMDVGTDNLTEKWIIFLKYSLEHFLSLLG